MRAAQSLFAFMTLVGPALAMAGLPALTCTLQESVAAARALAMGMSAIAVIFVAAYLVAVGSFRGEVMAMVFGPEFEPFANLVIPVGVMQLLAGASIGFTMFLKAWSEGRTLFWMNVAHSASTLAFAVSLALYAGVKGAAWGFTLAAAVGAGSPSSPRFVWPPCALARPRMRNACREAQVARRLLRSSIATRPG